MPETADRPSIVLHGFIGGIVNNADIARRLAGIILESRLGANRFATYLPLQVQDCGASWLIKGSGEAPACSIGIRKRDGAALSLEMENHADALGGTVAAEKFASALAENAGGAAEASRQLPFAVADNGGSWLVHGSGNADRSVEGVGPFRLEVQKRDARVLDMCFEAVMHTPPEVREALRGNKRK